MFESQKNKILNFYKKHRRMPGYNEMLSLLGFKSKNAVYKLIQKMVDDGTVSKDAKGRIIPTKLIGELPFLGLVEAGIPTMAEALTSDTLSLDDYLIRSKEGTYILEVKGDSMIEEGIKEGDLVIVERRGEPKEGDIVIAEVDGGWTMKFFRKNGKQIYLEPANKKYKPIYPEYDLKIAAIVRGVIRKY
jgi:repressor LexA